MSPHITEASITRAPHTAKQLSAAVGMGDITERLDSPPEPYQNMTAGAAVEIMINAFGDALDPEISADAMRDDYDFSNNVYFDARMNSNPDLKTRMMQNKGRITPQKGAPYVQ